MIAVAAPDLVRLKLPSVCPFFLVRLGIVLVGLRILVFVRAGFVRAGVFILVRFGVLRTVVIAVAISASIGHSVVWSERW